MSCANTQVCILEEFLKDPLRELKKLPRLGIPTSKSATGASKHLYNLKIRTREISLRQ